MCGRLLGPFTREIYAGGGGGTGHNFPMFLESGGVGGGVGY